MYFFSLLRNLVRAKTTDRTREKFLFIIIKMYYCVVKYCIICVYNSCFADIFRYTVKFIGLLQFIL